MSPDAHHNGPRQIDSSLLTGVVKRLFIEANTCLGQDVVAALENALPREESPIGQSVLTKIIDNAKIARQTSMPICQDTGLAVVFVEIGQAVWITGSDATLAIQKGVRQAYEDGFLRKSVCDPLTRANTKDNTPAVIYWSIVPGDQIRIIAMPKGGGSENMSRIRMLTPSAGMDGVKQFVVETVSEADANPCPPIIVGVGIGGSMEQAGLLAKKALLRPVGRPHPTDERLVKMEEELYQSINETGIGPAGLGGRVTALGVAVEMVPCHIASLPVAVNIQCHVSRHLEETI